MVLTLGTKQEYSLLNLLYREKMTVSDKYGFLTKETYLAITSCLSTLLSELYFCYQRNVFTSRVGLFFCSHAFLCCIY